MAALWHALTEPPASIQLPESRRRARLLSSLLAVMIPLTAFSSLAVLMGIPQALDVRSLVPGLLVLALAYLLNRTGLYAPAAALTVGAVFLFVVFSALLENQFTELDYLVLAVLVGGLIFSPHATVIIYLAALGVVVALAASLSSAHAEDVIDTFYAVGTLGLFSLIVTFLRRQDITRIESQSRALALGEARLANILNTAAEIIITIDERQNILLFNQAAEQIFGYQAAEVLGLPLDRLLPPRFREAHPQHTNEFAASPEPFRRLDGRSEILGRRKDGSEFPMEAGISRLSSDGHTVFTFIGSDITTRKQAAEALRESEAHYRSLFENMLNGFAYCRMIFDAQGIPVDFVYLEVNPAFGRLTGLSGVVGKPVSEVLPGIREASPELFAIYGRVASTGTGESLEFDFKSQGQWLFISVYGAATGYFVAIFEDISERKRAEVAVRQSEERHRALVEQAADGIFVADAQGRYLEVNTSACAMLGYTREELLGADYRLILRPEDLAQDPPNIGLLLQGEKLVRERIYTRKDGTLFPVEISAALISDGRVQNIVRDITERKRAEETLQHRLTELEALHSVSQALRTAQTSDEALPILLDETLAALETGEGIVWLYHPEDNELYTAVARGWFKQYDTTPLRPGEGIAGTVFASDQPYLVANFAEDPLSRQPGSGQIPAGWGGVSVPIVSGAKVAGVLMVAVPPSRPVTPEQVKLLEALAEMGGAAMHRMSLHQKTERQLERLQALNQVDLAITSGMDLRLTLNILLEHIKIQLDVDAADVLLLDPRSLMLEYITGIGFRTSGVRSDRVRLGESLAGRAALERKAIQADNPASERDSPQFAAFWADEQFAFYYGVPLIAKGEVRGVLEVYDRAPCRPDSDWTGYLETLAGQAALAIDSAQLFDNLQRSNIELALAYDATIEGWSHALDLRDKETEGHTLRVTELTGRLAQAMGIGEAERVHIRRGALLHDIGKMGVPDRILLKPGPLTGEEWAVMRMHPRYAYDLLSPIAYLRPALDIPYCHHEKWDGTGYPRGLSGEQIPLSARLFAVNDVWDALRSDRPYRAAWPEEKVREHIQALSGTHFDPRVVRAFFSSVNTVAMNAG